MTRICLLVTMMEVTALMSGAAPAAEPQSDRPPRTVADKTLVVWVAPANLGQRGGGVLGIGGTAELFDAIVFGEIETGKWMAGSNFFARTSRDQSAWPPETAGPDTFVQIAIAYEGRQVRLFRDGQPYAEYTMAAEPATFTTDSPVTLGLRHLGAQNGYFAGALEEARIYDRPLDAAALAALKPGRQGDPAPIGWWTFENGRVDDRMGNFASGKLLGDARIEGGRLVLGGDGFVLCRQSLKVVREANGWPLYHVTALPDEGIGAPYDANGCLYWKGKYHLMYIFQSPDGRHCWGHLSSPDLIHWTYLPTALEPRPGDPDHGIFSGNAFVNKDGVPMLCWFGIDAGVCVATAQDDDLIVWEKHPRNPIIPVPKEGEPGHGVYTVWDPYLWLEGDAYMCLLGGNLLPMDRDTLYLCTSPDLVTWTPIGPFYEGDPAWRRPDEDCSCPDFFRVAIEGHDPNSQRRELGHVPQLPGSQRRELGHVPQLPEFRHVLMCISHAIGGRFYMGRLEGQTFVPERHVRMNWPGGMYFAPESLEAPDGRRIFWAWVTDPRIQPAQRVTGSGFQSLPRVLDLAEDGTPRITPARELEALRRKARTREDLALPADSDTPLEGIRGAHLELSPEIDPGDAREVGIKVRCSPNGEEETAVWWDREAAVLRVDVSRSTLREDVTYGSPPFTSYGLQRAQDNANPILTFEAPFELPGGEPLRLRVFLDGPMLEVFANDRQCVTQVIYPKRDDSLGIKLCARGGAAEVKTLRAWEMKPLQFEDRR